MSDAKSLDKSITVAGDRKGFIALNSNKALIDTATSVGMTNEKMKNINDKDFISNMMKDLQNQGMSLKSFKNADKSWKTGAAFLSAIGASQARKQTMRESLVDDSGKTADVAVGTDGHANKMSIDGATVINDGRKVDTQNVTKSGDIMDTGVKMKAAMNYAVAASKKDASKEDVAKLAEMIHNNAELGNFLLSPEGIAQGGISAIRALADQGGLGHIVDDTLKKTADQDGGLAGEVGQGLAWAGGTLAANHLVKKATGEGLIGHTANVAQKGVEKLRGKSSNDPNNGSNDNTGNGSDSKPNQDSKHGNSFRDDIKNYTEEHMEEAREKIKETKKLENLENQRANLKDGDPRASRLATRGGDMTFARNSKTGNL